MLREIEFKKFTKEERSTFTYWFYHWYAFNYTACKLHAWKFKYLFHDIEKPWLKLFLPYPTVQKWHRSHNTHHLEYFYKYEKKVAPYSDKPILNWFVRLFIKEPDAIAMMIDWECSGLTKHACSRNARDEWEVKKVEAKEYTSPELLEKFDEEIQHALYKLGL